MATTSRQVGITLGAAVFGAVHAPHACWWIVAGLGLAISALGALATSAWAQGTARRAACVGSVSGAPGSAGG